MTLTPPDNAASATHTEDPAEAPSEYSELDAEAAAVQLELERLQPRAPKLPPYRAFDLKRALERLCEALGTTSRGFDVDAIDAVDQWAIQYTKFLPGPGPVGGWMVVAGLGGCGSALTRWNGYCHSDWDMLMALELGEATARRARQHLGALRRKRVRKAAKRKKSRGAK